MSASARDQYKLNWVYGVDQMGLSKTVDHICTGLNSGYQAISLAVLFGATRILLLGFDFQHTNGKTHWHGDHPKGLGNGGQFPRWIHAMNRLSIDAKARGIYIINCSRKTALTCFARATIEEALPDAAQ